MPASDDLAKYIEWLEIDRDAAHECLSDCIERLKAEPKWFKGLPDKPGRYITPSAAVELSGYYQGVNFNDETKANETFWKGGLWYGPIPDPPEDNNVHQA